MKKFILLSCLALGIIFSAQAQQIQCTQNADYVVDYGDGYAF